MRVPFRKIWIYAIVAALIVLVFMNTCGDNSTLLTAMLTSALFLSLWSTQFAIASGRLPDRWHEYPLALAYDFSFLILFAFACALVFPTADCYSDRIRVSEALAAVSGVKTDVSEAILANKTIRPQVLDRPTQFKNLAYLEVESSGRILVVTETPSATVRLIPNRAGDRIKWECHGRPDKLVPANCRR